MKLEKMIGDRFFEVDPADIQPGDVVKVAKGDVELMLQAVDRRNPVLLEDLGRMQDEIIGRITGRQHGH